MRAVKSKSTNWLKWRSSRFTTAKARNVGTRACLLEDVSTIDDRRKDGGVGRRCGRSPRSSSALTSVGSVYRGGGVVEWPSGSSVRRLRPDRRSAAEASLLVVLRGLVGPARRRRGSRERQHGARGAELDVLVAARGRTDPERDRLAACVLHLRRGFASRSGRRAHARRGRARLELVGVRNVSPAGRTASWASWAFATALRTSAASRDVVSRRAREPVPALPRAPTPRASSSRFACT